MDATKPYEFIGLGVMDVTKPYETLRFGAVDATKPYEFIRFWAGWAPSGVGNPLTPLASIDGWFGPACADLLNMEGSIPGSRLYWVPEGSLAGNL